MKPRADEDDGVYATFLGIGNLHGVAEPDPDRDEPPSIWLPEHRSGSRLGGWKKVPFQPQRPRTIGFRSPR